jgi:hypothetical protein
MTKYNAYEIKGEPNRVFIPALRGTAPTEIARDRGYPIISLDEATRAFGTAIDNTLLGDIDSRLTYVDAITSLPEAATRPRAALMLIEAHNAKSLPPEQAARFLRGLPSEMSDYRPEAPAAFTPAEAPRIRRKMELRHTTLSIRTSDRPAVDQQQHVAIGYALKMINAGTDVLKAVHIAGVDMSKLQ